VIGKNLTDCQVGNESSRKFTLVDCRFDHRSLWLWLARSPDASFMVLLGYRMARTYEGLADWNMG